MSDKPTFLYNNGVPEMVPMKVIDMTNKVAAKAYLTRPVEDTHTKEELEAVHRAVRFTQMFKQEESLDKMNEEEVLQHSVPPIDRRLL